MRLPFAAKAFPGEACAVCRAETLQNKDLKRHRESKRGDDTLEMPRDEQARAAIAAAKKPRDGFH